MEEELREKLEKGWIHSKMWFEVLAIEEKITEESLKNHIEKLKKQPNTIIVKENFEEVREVSNPLPKIDKAFSQVCEVEVLTKDIETLLFDVIFFAPSAVEILHPEKLNIKANSLQVIMNSVADLIHRYAAAGIGGIIISAKK